jgi:hypothetical protein
VYVLIEDVLAHNCSSFLTFVVQCFRAQLLFMEVCLVTFQFILSNMRAKQAVSKVRFFVLIQIVW